LTRPNQGFAKLKSWSVVKIRQAQHVLGRAALGSRFLWHWARSPEPPRNDRPVDGNLLGIPFQVHLNQERVRCLIQTQRYEAQAHSACFDLQCACCRTRLFTRAVWSSATPEQFPSNHFWRNSVHGHHVGQGRDARIANQLEKRGGNVNLTLPAFSRRVLRATCLLLRRRDEVLPSTRFRNLLHNFISMPEKTVHITL
jgi:hypothetical protein